MAVRDRHSSGKRIVAAVLLAIGAHLVVAGAIMLLDALDLLSPPPLPPHALAANSHEASDESPMQIETFVDELKAPDEKTEEEKKQEEAKKKEEEDKNPHGQVVDIAKPAIEQRPDQAKFVSEYDSTVEHEMKKNGREQGGVAAGATASSAPPPVPQGTAPNARPTRAPAKGGAPGPLAMRATPDKPAPRGEDEPLPPDVDGEKPMLGKNGGPKTPKLRVPVGSLGQGPQAEPNEATPGTPGLPTPPNLKPSEDMLAKAIGKGGGTMDYLKDIDDGEGTALNAKKWKHAPFFNRVKRQVADEWHPELVYLQHDPNGNVYGVKDRVTVLRVHLTPDGKLAAWNVLQPSGVDFLDDVAIDAFKKAAPFPNPPKDLVDPDGQIHFNFAFIFQLSGHGSLKVYKYQ